MVHKSSGTWSVRCGQDQEGWLKVLYWAVRLLDPFPDPSLCLSIFSRILEFLSFERAILTGAGLGHTQHSRKMRGRCHIENILNSETSGPLPSLGSQKINSQRECSSRRLVDFFLRKPPRPNEKTALILSCKSPIFLKPKHLSFSRSGFSQLKSLGYLF